jgi:hypothetical protein
VSPVIVLDEGRARRYGVTARLGGWLRAGASLTHVRGLPGRGRLLGLSDSCGRPRLFTERTSAGLDVHARSVAAAAIDGVTGELFESRLTPSFDHIASWLGGLPGPVAVVYEAGPTGFGLYRRLRAVGSGARSPHRASCTNRRVTG